MEKIVMCDTVKLPETVVVLGNFDGVHRGHTLLVDKAKETAKEEGLHTAVFTFFPHPSFVLSGKQPVDMIYNRDEKILLMEELGIDYYVELPFSVETAGLEPKAFIEKIILGQMNARAVVVGSDYRFGRNREGDYKLLVEYAQDNNFDVVVVHKLKHDHQEISSTWVREEIKSGNMELVNKLLGKPFFFYGIVVHGRQIGTTIGFPTANIVPESGKILPPNGVYVSKIYIDEEEFLGITNIGRNPTVVDGQGITVEAHILDFDRDIYGKRIRVELHHFVRPEVRFNSLDELKHQISIDTDSVRDYFF